MKHLFCLLVISLSLFAQTNPCDLNMDGVVNSTDVNLAVEMVLNQIPCTANIEAANSCTVISIQRIINASLGGICITYNTHKTTLTWTASTSTDVAGYNMYRSTGTNDYYTKINTTLITSLTYQDLSVLAGTTYVYYATAVDTSGNESVPSNTATATIPTP